MPPRRWCRSCRTAPRSSSVTTPVTDRTSSRPTPLAWSSGSGRRAILLPGPIPTPLLAFAVRHLAADAGVAVTASHNPAADNGYKVYLADGAQIGPPDEDLLAAALDEISDLHDAGSAGAVPFAARPVVPDPEVGGAVARAYVDDRGRSPGSRAP